jgi:serine/threonine-protein kinase RsbT
MNVLKREVVPLGNSNDVVQARQQVRLWATELRFSLIDQTKLVTAASELARNTVLHGNGGEMAVEVVASGGRTGLRMIFEDQGPGIADVDQALKDGFTSGSGMGLGLGGSKRLVNEFDIQTEVGKGTRISATRWK